MLKIRALNRDSLSDEDAPVLRKELQEEIALEMYNNALHLVGLKDFEKSKELLLKLLNENIPQLENQGGLPKSMCTLKFACNLNLGHIFHEKKDNTKALEYYLIASELDQGDITLWYKIGKLSLEEHRFKQSIYAFSKGLDCYDSHWPCLEEIISLLFAVKDTVNCLFYISKTLELDPNYTKGLVLRKKIYQDNPATKEYYQALNPDHKWEPPLDVEINCKLEEKYLNEVQAIRDIINEGEKALESEPLKTIPLPEGLENYSWVALSKCISSLYKYLQSNEMSFLTFLDLEKCMSTAKEHEVTVKSEEQVEVKNEESEVITDQDNNLEEKADHDVVMNRRPSQNSEDNGTPLQTDNDDEQQTEQDGDEQDEKSDKTRSKNLKRKRDLLTDLRVWGWHSKRKNVRKTRPDKFYTVEDCLNQVLPSNLLRNKIVDAYLQDESINDVDGKQSFLECNDMNVFLHSDSCSSTNDTYFGSTKEKEDVMKLWNNVKEDCDITILIREYIRRISELWNIKWPKELITHYIFIHERYSEIYHLPNIYDPENKFEDIRIETLSNLLHAEFILFGCPKDQEENNTSLNIGQVQFVESSVALWETNWKEEYTAIFLRIIWLRAYIARKEKSYDTAVRYLELMKERITEEEEKTIKKYSLSLPNLYKFTSINFDVVEKNFKHLHMIKSVSCLEELFEHNKYEQVSEIVISTFESDSGYPTVGRIGRPTQLGMLLHSLWYTDFDICFLWCEECLFESYPHYTRPGPNRPQWEGVVEKCLLMMHEIIKNKSRNVVDILSNEKKARLTETLSRVICKQMYAENTTRIPLNTVSPWFILHHLLAKNEEKIDKDNTESNENEVPASLAILFSAHEFLGPKSWCLTGKGELLHYILDVLLDKEDAYKYERLREKLDIQIEQALFCLYQHPSKKNKISRHLADHNVDPLPLTWEKSFQLYEFYAPEVLPEFNSFKNASITMDLEQLLLRITALVTPECNPSVSVPKIKEYLQGKIATIPEAIEFPYRIQAIYYLLGDYYFKLKDFVRCVDFFLMDLAINPKRVDSWACLGLSYLNQLEIKLNFCKKMKNEQEFLDRAKYAQVAFTTALKLSPENITLWIEFASFEYMAHSFCSRYLGHESENMNMDKFTQLEDRKNAFLESSRQSFEKAIALYDSEGSEPDERWLHYYILGKIAEKKQSEPKEYLGYYLTASQLLDENNATYPEKITYNAPQHLSVEALELHYRMNASILKYLEVHEGKPIDHSVGALFKKSLDALPINRKLCAIRAQKKLRKSTEINEKPTEINEKATVPDQCGTVEDGGETVKTTQTDKPNLEQRDEEKPNENTEVTKTNENKIEETEKNEKTSEDKNETNIEVPPNDESKVDELNVEKNSKIMEKDSEKEVRVVDEVILLDSEYDVILILSSDDEDSNDSKCVEKETEKEEEQRTEENSENQISNKTEKSEKLISTNDKITENLNNIEETIISNTNENISDQIASGVDVQLILDKMMQETMKTTEEQPMEIDSDTVTGLDKTVKNIDNNREQDEQIDEQKNIDQKEKERDSDENKKSTGESTTSGSSSSSSISSSSSSESDSDEESTSDSSSSSSEDSSSEYLSKSEIIHLIERCLKGLELCIIRLPKNYKAVYRLVHLFFHYREKKDLNKCKQLLLGEYKCYENSLIVGLFSDRKNNNFFNGIWRIPSSEIDRPGSLSAHMIRCVTILLQILRASGDFKILIDMHFQLKKCPDPDKIYIKDSERSQFSDQAISLSIQTLRENVQNVDKENHASIKKLLQDIYKVYLRIQKYAPEKENVFGNMLVDLYKIFVKEKITDTVNVLELAVKFCQQMKLAEKQSLIASQNLALQNPLASMGPVLPSPATINAGNPTAKRASGMGRPRGRPPLPKIPGQVKLPRTKSWKKSGEPNTQDYLKHYREELMKQYNQNLNLLQSAQFAQLYSNSLLSSYVQAQQSANMLGTNFLQQLSALGMSQGTSIDPLRMNFSTKQYEEMAEMMRKMAELSKKETATINSPSKVDSPKKIEQSTKKHKTEFASELPAKKQKLQTDSLKPTATCQQKKVENAPSISILPVPKEKSQAGSCVSSISIIPRADSHPKEDSESVIKGPIGKITKSAENAVASSETSPRKSLESTKSQSPLSVIMAPPILPSSSTITISNVDQSSKTCESKLKLMETTISKIPQNHSESMRKAGKDDLQSSISYAKEAGLLKFPPSLSMTPVISSTQKSEFQQSISLLKTSSSTSGLLQDSYLPKLPSSITLTPSISKSNDFQGHLEATRDPKKFKSTNSGKNSSTNALVTKSSDYPKSKSVSKLKNNEPSLPFNVDSMLQTSVKSKTASPRLSYGFMPPQVAHTSVITSTIPSLDSTNISSMFAQPNPVLTDKRSLPKTVYGFPTKSNIMARNILSSEYCKVDDQRHFDLPMYPSPRKDMTSSKSPSGTVITSVNKPSTYNIPSQTTSPVKTLQEKLADKKREQANKQLLEQMSHLKPVMQQQSNCGNPHSVSKILSQSSSSEISTSIPKTISRTAQPSLSPQSYSNISVKTPRRKSSSEESVIFLD